MTVVFLIVTKVLEPTSNPSVFFATTVAVDVASIIKESYRILVEPPLTEWNTFGAFRKWRLDIVMLLEDPKMETSVGRA